MPKSPLIVKRINLADFTVTTIGATQPLVLCDTIDDGAVAEWTSEKQAIAYCVKHNTIGLVTEYKVMGYTDTDPVKITLAHGNIDFKFTTPRIAGLYHVPRQSQYHK